MKNSFSKNTTPSIPEENKSSILTQDTDYLPLLLSSTAGQQFTHEPSIKLPQTSQTHDNDYYNSLYDYDENDNKDKNPNKSDYLPPLLSSTVGQTSFSDFPSGKIQFDKNQTQSLNQESFIQKTPNFILQD
jgi:hypothetical protein